MNQLVQNQNLYPDPFSYFANTPRSITFRKNKALRLSPMKIINFTKNDDGSFIVSIKGVRGIPYQVFFSEQEITCSCPDYQKHSVKPICKHMFKCICLSENDNIFNNVMLLSELMNSQYLCSILENIMRIIDIKKMERYGNPQNQISIERDEYCSICYGDFDTDIVECSKCKHVFHQNCISLSWNSASRLSHGKCPMCREPNSFPQFGGFNNNDPWEIYNFQLPAAVEEPLAAAQQDILLNSEVEQNANANIPIEPIEVEQNENNAFFQKEPFFPVEDNSDTPPSSPLPLPSIEESDSSLLEQYDFESIDRRIKVLNILLFILETMNIIFNNRATRVDTI